MGDRHVRKGFLGTSRYSHVGCLGVLRRTFPAQSRPFPRPLDTTRSDGMAGLGGDGNRLLSNRAGRGSFAKFFVCSPNVKHASPSAGFHAWPTIPPDCDATQPGRVSDTFSRAYA